MSLHTFSHILQTRDRCHVLEIRLASANREKNDAIARAESSERKADQLGSHLQVRN